MFLLLALLLALAPAPVADKEFDQALAAFEGVQGSKPLDEKVAALERLVDLGNLNATAPIVAEYGRTAVRLREKQVKAERLGYVLERKRIVIANLESLGDKVDEELLEDQREQLAEMESDLASADERIRELSPWRDALAGGVGLLFELVGPSKRKRAEDVVWTDAEGHPDPAIRLASVELLGTVGGPGAALRLQKLLVEWTAAIDDDRELLAEEMVRVRRVEKLMQDEQRVMGGRMSQGTQAEYERVKQEAGRLQQRMRETEGLVESAVSAGARALAREEGKQLDKSVASLVRALKKNKGRARLNVLTLISRADSDGVRAHARELLVSEKDALARAELIDGLAAMRDEQLVPLLLDRFLVEDDSWLVRSRAARALAYLRVKAAIPVLIERMDVEEGRVRTDVEEALVSLTGQRFHGRVERWRRWWADNGADFEVAEKPAEKSVVEQAREARGVSNVSFFGVATDSRRVLFVLDVSGSMDFSMIPKQNPTDDPGLPYDRPGKEEISRLTAAKRDLVKALGGLPEGALFNVVLYASDVWTWADGLVEMSAGARQEVNDYVEEAGAVGGTNIYGALERALDLAGAGTGEGGQWTDPEIDTVYLLTDGRATVGLTTDPDDILAFVRERNRDAGITIHTIGLSGAHDASLLRRMAEENGGKYVGR